MDSNLVLGTPTPEQLASTRSGFLLLGSTRSQREQSSYHRDQIKPIILSQGVNGK